MSLIEEALRRQQEQERHRLLEAPLQAAPAVVPEEPPPLPPLVPLPSSSPTRATPAAAAKPASVMNLAPLILSVAGMVALVGLAAGLTWKLTSSRLHAKTPAPEPAHARPPLELTHKPPAELIPADEPQTNAVTAVDAEPVSAPEPEHAPVPAEPPEPWPPFTLKGLVSFGGTTTLMLGSGQILEVGDKTAAGIQLVSVTPERVRLAFKTQTRDYRLQAGSFVLLPPPDTAP